jgi:hypothetical protein
MKITIDIDADKLIDDIMGGQPEASVGLALQCYDWNYKRGIWDFHDTEYGMDSHNRKTLVKGKVQDLDLTHGPHKAAVTFRLTRPALRRGLKLLIDDLHAGKLPGLAEDLGAGITDAGNWDMFGSDALVQYTIYGKLIYG